MATSDLLAELQKAAFKTDSDTEARICNIILQQLEDTSGDISSLALKWYARPGDAPARAPCQSGRASRG